MVKTTTMMFLLLVCLGLSKHAKSCFTPEKMKYKDLEGKILSGDNLEILRNTFFPINSHSKTIINVSYHFVLSDVNSSSTEPPSDTKEYPAIIFYWLSSAVHLCLDVDMLHGLSLRAYNPEISNVSVAINVSGLCSKSKIIEALNQLDYLKSNNSKTLCSGGMYLLNILNNFTANLQMYALGQTSFFEELMHPERRGYSVYYYSPNILNKCCVLQRENEYKQLRYIFYSGSLLIFACTIFGFPLLFYEFYKIVLQKLNEQSGSEYWRFITWSVVMVSLIANILILINNSYVLSAIFSRYDFSAPTHTFLTVFIIFCFGAWVINFLSCVTIITYLDRTEDTSFTFPLPLLLDKILIYVKCFRCYNSNRIPRGIKCFPHCTALALGYTIFVHFLQLMSFHILYIILGAIASPAETLSVLCDYFTAYIFSVISVAVILKYMNKLYFKQVHLNCLACVLPLSIAGLCLITAVACFTVYFYFYTEMMETNSQNEGLWGVMKTILPSLVVLFLGYCGHKLLGYIRRGNRGGLVDTDNASLLSSGSGSSVLSSGSYQTQSTTLSLAAGYNTPPSMSSSNAAQNKGPSRVPVLLPSSGTQAPGSSHSNLKTQSQQNIGEKSPLLLKTS